jgi:hypothetical protein
VCMLLVLLLPRWLLLLWPALGPVWLLHPAPTAQLLGILVNCCCPGRVSAAVDHTPRRTTGTLGSRYGPRQDCMLSGTQ